MKKVRNIGLILGLIILISSNSKAQYYYTSYGYAQDWHLPNYVQYSISDNYFGYDIAHVRQFNRHGHRNYNVLIHRNGWFVELRLDRHGHIYKTVRHRYNYPLMAHSCTNHCGYHRAYYTNYYPKYHHNHYHGYKKTVYVNTHNGHKKNHYYNGHKQYNYYSNIYVDKQKKSNYNNKANNQQRRNDTVIRKPQQTNTRNSRVEHKRPTSTRSRYVQEKKTPSRSSNARSSRNLTASNNGRSSRGH